MKQNWITSKCLICKAEFQHTDTYTPKTCGKFECLQEANKRHLFDRDDLAHRRVIRY